MQFTWHEPKRQAPEEAWDGFRRCGSGIRRSDLHITANNAGSRGLLGEKAVVIVHSETENEIHVISMREADEDEQLLFFTKL